MATSPRFRFSLQLNRLSSNWSVLNELYCVCMQSCDVPGMCVCVFVCRVDESLCSIGKLDQLDFSPSLERRDTMGTVDGRFHVTGVCVNVCVLPPPHFVLLTFTFSPLLIPTFSPLLTPTFSPLLTPTFSPLLTPTFSPLLTPTFSPLLTPTLLPC